MKLSKGLMVVSITALLAITGCGNSTSNEEPTTIQPTSTEPDTSSTGEDHVHVFEEENVNAKYLASEADCTHPKTFYYSCECGAIGTETFEFGEPLGHSFTNYVSNEDSTCIHEGTETAKCDRCDETDTRGTGVYASHVYGEVSYVWSSDNKKCTATRSCLTEDCGRVETETVVAQIDKTDPSCGVAGSAVYTATFKNSAFETQVKTETIDPLTHDYRDVIDDDGNFTNKCVNCGDVHSTSTGLSSNGTLDTREFQHKEQVSYAEMTVKTTETASATDAKVVAGFTFHCPDQTFGDVLTFGVVELFSQYWILWSVKGNTSNWSGQTLSLGTTLPSSGVKIGLKIGPNGSADGSYDLFDGIGMRYLESQYRYSDDTAAYAWGDAYFNAQYIDGVTTEKAGVEVSDVHVNPSAVTSTRTFTGNGSRFEYENLVTGETATNAQITLGEPTAGLSTTEGTSFAGILVHSEKGDFTEMIGFGIFYLYGQYWAGWHVPTNPSLFADACYAIGGNYPIGATLSVSTYNGKAYGGITIGDGHANCGTPYSPWGQTSVYPARVYSRLSGDITNISTNVSGTTYNWQDGPGVKALSDNSVKFLTKGNTFAEYGKKVSLAGEGIEVTAKVTVPSYVKNNTFNGFSINLGNDVFLNYYVCHETWNATYVNQPVIYGGLNYSMFSPSNEVGLPDGTGVNRYWSDPASQSKLEYKLNENGDLVYYVKFICSELFGAVIFASQDNENFIQLISFPYTQVVSPNNYFRNLDLGENKEARLFVHQYGQDVSNTVMENLEVIQHKATTGADVVTEFDTTKIANVILMGGQSNMEGTDAVYSVLPEDVRAEYREGHDNVLIDHYCRAGQNFSNGFVPVDFGQGYSKGNLGPEVGFAKYLGEHAADENFYLIKSAYGGTNLYSDWSATGSHYKHFVADAHEAIKILEDAGVQVNVIGMLWMQGEADACAESSANNYGENLLALKNRVKSEFASNIDGTFTFTASYIHTGTVWTYSSAVNSAIAHFADAYTKVGATLDLINPYHYTAAAYLTLGEAFGETFLKARGYDIA